MTDVSYEFEVTTTPPADRRPRGPGRPRTNRFDEAVRKSYEEKWSDQITDDAPRGKWFIIQGIETKELAAKLEAQIRASASYWKARLDKPIGANVHWDPDTLVLHFRGCDKSQDVDKSPNGDGEAESVDEATPVEPTVESDVTKDAEIRDEELAQAPA